MSDDNSQCLLSENIKAVLVDVAGTTTSIGFVKDTLLPFASSNAEEFLKTNWEDDAVKEAVKALNGEKELNLEETTKLFKELTEASSDNAGLKTLQGLIYKKGYSAGDLKAHVFSDVPTAFEAWSKTHKIAIYSTGSVESQKLLFANTINGDLTSHISKYYDQANGAKIESESYKKISDDLAIKAEDIVFITDSVNEAKAAQSAKLEAILVTRAGNEELDANTKKQFKTIATFGEITFDVSGKRKNKDEPETTEERPAKVAKTEATTTTAAEKPEETPIETEVEVMDVVEQSETVAKEAEKPKETETEKPTETDKSEKTEQTETKTDQDNAKAEKPAEKEKAPETVAEEKEKETVVVETKETAVVETKETGVVETKEIAAVVVEEEKKGETEAPVVAKEITEKEKENKSELANGACETEQNGEVNGKTEEETKAEETEIKVKKLEESGETTSVSVEA